ncbi:hypothetical protein [Dyella sp. 20L07]|uniref:hypothetical protein n=1 Tax=Dyella sp. 20L07 TaxID=3384240 RepID=UPI003D29D4D8
MQRLSSPSTFFYKRVFPVFWFGFLAIIVIVGVSSGVVERRLEALPSFGMPVLMIIFGFVLFKRIIFDLVDEVWLDGDQLVIKNRGESSRIALSQVINVNVTTMTNPPRITLMLRSESSRLGKAVIFMPAGPRGFFSAFKPNPIATDLIQRIDALRRRPA